MAASESQDSAGRVLAWMAEAAEHTRPLPGVGRAHHGATPMPLPDADVDALPAALRPGPARG